MARVVVITGGNQGDVRSLLEQARTLIEERVGRVVKASAHYESEPWGFEAEASFWNQVLEVETALEPEELLRATQSVEADLGRDRIREGEQKALSGQRYASRTMDVDILFYDDRILSTEILKIPHPRIAEREFVLRPLCEILPRMCHPISGLRMEELYQKLKEEEKKER
ncbi:MAG: 2-amino-4-hydroxy-6-hydroxymethyldihydropteridine diphosphokinase [Rikenellaceae bacterium]|nr:2-amino-4-hydroxy-6-hydroxymethyldihydropteridine diphosphokinase [Rikenellaceae bacterium]